MEFCTLGDQIGITLGGTFLGVIIGAVIVWRAEVRPLMARIATMRQEGYISTVPAEPRPDQDDFWQDIPEG